MIPFEGNSKKGTIMERVTREINSSSVSFPVISPIMKQKPKTFVELVFHNFRISGR